ncbi:MAG: flagellar hook-length control protein FliK [Pseudoduganella sp.]|jgi:flagellar hook-length control protein FliK|nr:flagellar hook-length control protein FliK [Pseudoduganella sp.]
MNTQTVQTNPLLSGAPGATRAATPAPAQEDGQFQQALNRQIERQAAAVPPTPASSSAPRRAEAPKPAATPAPAAQQARPAAPAPAAKPAAPAQAAKAASQPAPEAAPVADTGAAAPAQAGAGQGSGDSTAAAAGQAADAQAAGDAAASALQPAADPIADMLMLMANLHQPASPAPVAPAGQADGDDALTGLAASAATAQEPPALPGQAGVQLASPWPGMMEGKAPRAQFDPARAADSLRTVLAHPAQDAMPAGADLAAMTRMLATLEARAGTAPDTAPDTAQDAAGTDALQTARAQPAASAVPAAAAQPDFQAVLAQASAEAGKVSEAAQPAPAALPAVTAQAPAGAANAQAAHAVASNQLHARVGSQGWDHQLSQKVVWMVRGAEQSATLTLNPPDLGPLQVVLNVSNDQASVAFTAAQPEVREALEQALPKLRETMSEAGIKLGDANVSAGSQEQREAFAEMAAGRGHGAGNDQNGNAAGADEAGQPGPTVRRGVLGAVDTFA